MYEFTVLIGGKIGQGCQGLKNKSTVVHDEECAALLRDCQKKLEYHKLLSRWKILTNQNKKQSSSVSVPLLTRW